LFNKKVTVYYKKLYWNRFIPQQTRIYKILAMLILQETMIKKNDKKIIIIKLFLICKKVKYK